MKRHSDQAVAWEKLVKKRTGITRTQPQAIVKGMPVARLIGSPEIVRERWIRIPKRYDEPSGWSINARSYHFCILRFRFQTADGRIWTTLQARTFDLKRGFTISLSGFWKVLPEQNPNRV